MKKRIATLLCTTVLSLGLTVAPVTASAGPFSPIEVETYTYGPLDELRVNKVYQLSQSDDPSNIPTEDFELGGRRYYLLDMTVASADDETVTYTAIFGSVELARMSGQPGQQALYTETDTGLGLLFILSCVGGAVMAALCAIEAKYSPRRSQGAERQEENQYGVSWALASMMLKPA